MQIRQDNKMAVRKMRRSMNYWVMSMVRRRRSMKTGSDVSVSLFPAITQTVQVSPLTLEHKLFLWLLRYPFQRAEDVGLALEASQSTIHRHLTLLCRSGH